MEQWFVYIIECTDSTFYIGTTNDIDKRLAKHNSGKGAKYTRGRTPVKLRYTQAFENRSEACKHEYKLKQYSREQKMELFSPTPSPRRRG